MNPSTGTTFVLIISLIASSLAVAEQAAECLPDCPCPTPKLFESRELVVKVEQSILQRQYDILSQMTLEDVRYSSLGPVKHFDGDTGLVLPADALNLKEGDSGAAILRLLKDLLLATGTETLTLKEVRFDEYPRVSIGSYWFLQRIRGLPVIQGGLAVKYNGKTKQILSVSANFIPDRELPSAPKLSAQRAEQIAGGEVLEPTYLGYFLPCCAPTPPKLVWAVRVWSDDSWLVYVDAITGVEVFRMNMTST